MDEAMRCDRVALIQNGKYLSIETPGKDKRRFQQKAVHGKSNREIQADKCLKEIS